MVEMNTKAKGIKNITIKISPKHHTDTWWMVLFLLWKLISSSFFQLLKTTTKKNKRNNHHSKALRGYTNKQTEYLTCLLPSGAEDIIFFIDVLSPAAGYHHHLKTHTCTKNVIFRCFVKTLVAWSTQHNTTQHFVI